MFDVVTADTQRSGKSARTVSKLGYLMHENWPMVLRKICEIVANATRRMPPDILRLKCTKFDFG